MADYNVKFSLATEWTELDHVVIATAIRHSGASLPTSVRQGRWWTSSLTFVTVLLVTFVADVDDVNSYALLVGLFLFLHALSVLAL